MLPLLSGIVLPLLLNSMVANVSYCFLIPSLIIKTWKRIVWTILASVQTVYLYYNILGRLLNDKADKMILGSRQHQPWQWGRIGYPHKYMILSCVMLSHQTCATLLQQPLHRWDSGPIDVILPIEHGIVKTKTRIRAAKRHQVEPTSTPRRPNVTILSASDYYNQSLQSIVPAIPTYLDLGYNASSDFEAVMSHEGAREVLLFGTDFGTDFAYWADFPDPSIPSNPTTPRPQVSYVGAWNDDNKDNATFNILIDTGASVNISGHASDCVGGLSGLVSLQPGSTINGLNGPTAAKGTGELLWQVVDNDATICSLCSPAYYVPGATMQLFSLQTLFRQHKAGQLTLDSNRLILELPGGGSITVHYLSSNLPLAQGKIILKRRIMHVEMLFLPRLPRLILIISMLSVQPIRT